MWVEKVENVKEREGGGGAKKRTVKRTFGPHDSSHGSISN